MSDFRCEKCKARGGVPSHGNYSCEHTDYAVVILELRRDIQAKDAEIAEWKKAHRKLNLDCMTHLKWISLGFQITNTICFGVQFARNSVRRSKLNRK